MHFAKSHENLEAAREVKNTAPQSCLPEVKKQPKPDVRKQIGPRQGDRRDDMCDCRTCGRAHVECRHSLSEEVLDSAGEEGDMVPWSHLWL